ncbi:L,D-transpeptidase [Thermomonospora cellulosilytica]|uniref:Lipoprotein-anchoring transpeptidase ErfK/SrfK n=1 Tax=Thermomonospora cellulosilytica TaxID=1411118 RepID=A0A7W3N0B9_9ACTN|nr:Ig-like domain-containing protein [Thermomonospora cellulosilytica]MBA9005180.1 lipoprotein-anchoring transpeptidase ErfK/SrfK [Thermomonospora cellulosilytica]
MSARGRLWLIVAGGAGAVTVFVAGCSGGGVGDLTSAEDATVTITPGNGTGSVRPDAPIEVKVAGGTLENVSVTGGDVRIDGRLSADRTSWRSARTLVPGTSYTVTVRARNGDGKTTASNSTFTTLKPARTFGISDVTPNIKGEKVGVGMPIIVHFDRPVTNKAVVERALEVKAEKPVEGAWRWIDSTQVVYRPKEYWKPYQKVYFTARLAGVQGAKGVWGTKDGSYTMQIGAEQITTGNINKHHATVYRDGKKLRTMPFSAGNGTTREYTTTSGVHLLMEKGNPVKMTAPGRKKGDDGWYEQMVNHAIRISNSGEYFHAAPWSVGSQGRANVSHGCLNLSPENARWYYGIHQRGDVVKLTGTDRQLEWNNGWGYWQLSFEEWKEGSALH